ncbi:MAG: HprK-related kinase A [Methyloprofundus sp.]|nr:HprK-related kinase A [Methyloprofundus sp.]
MKIKDITFKQLVEHSSGSKGLCVSIGPFVVRIRTKEKSFLQTFSMLYQDFEVSEGEFVDFHIDMRRPTNVRRWVNAQIIFWVDGIAPFEPFPLDHAFPLFEWGLNWCIGRSAHQYLMLHSGVVEKYGKAIIFPALPGSGKSTLSSALGLRGWRFLSDEFGLIRANDGLLQPMPRPVPLKNTSIQVIQNFETSAVLGPVYPKTRKGTVSHLQSPTASVEQSNKLVKPAMVIFPRYQEGSETIFEELPAHYAFLKLSTNSFNYEVMGLKGFERVRDMIDSCTCLSLTYSNLDDVIDQLDKRLVNESSHDG